MTSEPATSPIGDKASWRLNVLDVAIYPKILRVLRLGGPYHMKITERYAQLIDELQSLQAAIAHVARADYSAHQRQIDGAGAKVIAFEVEHGVDQARRLIEHEKGFAGQLEQFEDMVRRYNVPIDWAAEVTAGSVAQEDLEDRMGARALVLAEARKGLATVTRMRADADVRRKKLSPEVLVIAGQRDPLNGYERSIFTELYLADRPARVTREVITEKELAGV
jgi:hypothetical protein